MTPATAYITCLTQIQVMQNINHANVRNEAPKYYVATQNNKNYCTFVSTVASNAVLISE